MTVDKKIPDIDLERFALGELGAEQTKDVQQRLSERPDEAERLATLLASNDEILADYPPKQMAAGIKERLDRKTGARGGKALWLAAPLTALAMTVLVVVGALLSTEATNPGHQSPEVILTKGDKDPVLYVYRYAKSGEERLRPGSSANSGDVIQLRYAARGARHGVIFSVDGRGTLTLHFPSRSHSSTKLSKRGVQSLSFSYELDDAPHFERFFFVTGSHPIDVEDILEIGRSLGTSRMKPRPLPSHLKQRDFLLRKENR